jgi:hypothetical protein
MLDLKKIQAALAKRKTLRQRRAEEDDGGVDLEPLMKSQPLLSDLQLSGYEDDLSKRLLVANHLLKKTGRISLRPLLPALLQLKGQPYVLRDHFPFEPFFRTRMPKMTLLKTGRQVSKSTSLAAQGVLFSNCIPYFSTLYVTPLFEMIRRFSQNYVRPFIETSPVMKLFSGTSTTNSVLQKSFKNRSSMHFSFAFLDAERTRGISADKNSIDEVQDIDINFLSIIHETMSGSRDWGLVQYAGTPKSMDNTIERLFLDSSMAEWMIPCGRCNKENFPNLANDLINMIGPWHAGISEECPGVICAKCRRPINPRIGRWIHTHPDRRWSFAGYHVPQIIMPMHYASEEKWAALKGKQAGRGNTPLHVFFNEVCGESFDAGSKMVTITDLKRAANLPWDNKLDQAKERIGEYLYRICSVDWGGGGTDSKGKTDERYRSYTTIAVLGVLPGGQIHVIYGYRSMTPHAHVREAKLILGIMAHFRCSHLVHDFTGAGSTHETIIKMAGMPLDRIVPVAMQGACKGNIFQFIEPTRLQPRWHYKCDKPRSLGITCELIKQGVLRFFRYDHRGSEDQGLLHDFLHLIEDKSDKGGMDVYKILHDPAGPDDFAMAVNQGVMAICQMSKMWPDVAKYAGVEMSTEAMESCFPVSVKEWDDML